MPKIIWYIHPYAGTPELGGAVRPYYLASVLNSHLYHTYVITSNFHHLLKRIRQFDKVQKEKFNFETQNQVDFVWVKTPSYLGNGIKRIWNMFLFSIRIFLLKNQNKLIPIPDIIIASSPHLFHIWFSYRLARKFKAKFVVEIRDIWPQSLIEILKVSRLHPLVIILRFLERMAYKKADVIVSLIPEFKKYITDNNFRINKRIYHIPNGTRISSPIGIWKDDNLKIRDLLTNLKKSKRFILIYAGAMGAPNALDQLIEALKILKLKGLTEIYTLLFGEGEMKQSLIKKKEGYNLDQIHFFPYVPRSILIEIFTQVDVAFIGWNALELYQYGVSANKMFEYMSAGLPIIQAGNFKNEVDLVLKAGCGITVPSENYEKLAEAIITLFEMEKEVRFELGKNGLNYVKNYHTYEKLGKEYANIFQSITT